MPKFIELKDEDGAEFAVNVEMITKIIPAAEGELTECIWSTRKMPSKWRKSMEEILAKVRAAT